MQHAKHDDSVRPKDEEDAVRKASQQYATYFRLAAQAGVLTGIGDGVSQGGFNGNEEFPPQTGSLVSIPHSSFSHVSFGLNTDNKPVGH
ncbi:MAG: hypothetical protein WCI73_09530 [Phycisphaerae bacterium]